MLRGCFVTGSDTGVGKTVLAAAIVASLRARGEPVCARKPVLTGLDQPDPLVPFDHELLALAGGGTAEEVAPLRYGPAVSPHLAAELAGAPIDVEALLADLRTAPAPVVVEGIGGLLVPLAAGWDVRRLALESRARRGRRRAPGSRNDQPHAADARGGPLGGARSARGRADAVAG